jgi:chemotaxis protein MotA
MTKINYLSNNKSFDFSTIIGICLTFLFLFWAMNLGGNIQGYIDVPAILIVLLGTLTLTFASCGFDQMIKLPRIVGGIIFFHTHSPRETAKFVLEVAALVKSQPAFILENKLNFSQCDYFFRKSIMLAIDNLDPEKISNILQQEINTYSDDIAKSISIIRKAGELAPPMGLIGTLIGLIQMLQNLHDIDRLGPAMSVALLTTFYGTVLSYVVFFPLAAKVEKNFNDRMLNIKIYLEGTISIAKKENPRLLEIYINSLLSPENNINYFKNNA